MDHNVLGDPSRWRGLPPPKPVEGPLSAPPIERPPPQDESPLVPPREVLLDSSGRLSLDLACRQCGYNLRGLAIAGACPECQTPIGKSVRPDLLRFAEPRWVQGLSLGMTLILVSLAMSVVLGVSVTIVGSVLTASGTVNGPQIVGAILLAVWALAGVVVCAGYWLLTSPDPGELEQKQPITARVVARWGLLASLANGPLQAVWMIVGPGVTSVPTLTAGGISALIGAMSLVVSIAYFIGLIALFIHVRRLALRIHDPALESQTRIVMWGIGALNLLTLVWSVIMLFTGIPTPITGPSGPVAGGGYMAFIALACVMGAVGLIFGIWGLILMFRYRARFSAQAALARANWVEEGTTQSEKP